jgi:hypothetical protein
MTVEVFILGIVNNIKLFLIVPNRVDFRDSLIRQLIFFKRKRVITQLNRKTVSPEPEASREPSGLKPSRHQDFLADPLEIFLVIIIKLLLDMDQPLYMGLPLPAIQ